MKLLVDTKTKEKSFSSSHPMKKKKDGRRKMQFFNIIPTQKK